MLHSPSHLTIQFITTILGGDPNLWNFSPISQHQFLFSLLPTTKVADHNLTALCRCQRSPHAHIPYPQPKDAPYGEHNMSCRVASCPVASCPVASCRVASCATTRTINKSYVFLRTPCLRWSWRTDTSQTCFSGAWISVILSSYFCTTLTQYPKAI
jgi:hypothetical protein